MWTRIEAGELGEWNKVITSLTPALIVSVGGPGTHYLRVGKTYFLEETFECTEHVGNGLVYMQLER